MGRLAASDAGLASRLFQSALMCALTLGQSFGLGLACFICHCYSPNLCFLCVMRDCSGVTRRRGPFRQTQNPPRRMDSMPPCEPIPFVLTAHQQFSARGGHIIVRRLLAGHGRPTLLLDVVRPLPELVMAFNSTSFETCWGSELNWATQIGTSRRATASSAPWSPSAGKCRR